MPGDRYRVQLLGPFGLFSPNSERIPLGSKRAAALIALLAMTPAGERTRVWLQTMLWGSRATEQAQASLRRELSTLGKLLAPFSPQPLITRTPLRVILDLNQVEVDALAITPGALRSVMLPPAFLEGIDLSACEEFEDWLRSQRSRIEEVYRTVIEPPLPESMSAQDVFGGPLPPRMDLLRKKPLPLSPKPSIAILPFRATDPGRETATTGLILAEAASMSLARYPHIFVVSTSSAAALVERRQAPTEIAAALGVQYLLEGSVSEGAAGIHVTARLIDGASGQQRWASEFTRPSGDLILLQNELAQAIAPQIWTHIDLAERHRGLLLPIQMDNSYHVYWRANALFHQWTPVSISEALALTTTLVAQEPHSGWAAAINGFCNAIAYSTGWAEKSEVARRSALLQYQNALRLEPDNVEVMGYAAGTLALIGGDLAIADHLINRALSLFPSYQPSLFWGGWVDLANGKMARASERFELSLRINPISGVRAYAITGIGLARLMEGAIDEAYALLFEAHIHIPHYAITMAGLCMAAVLKGERSVAETVARRLRQGGSVDRVYALFPDPAHRALLASVLAQL